MSPTGKSSSGRPWSAQTSNARPFSDLVVVEMAGSLAGAYCGKLLADYGATAVLVEPEDGDPLRRRAPFVPAADGGMVGARFSQLHTSKRSVVASPDQLAALVGGADVVIESAAPEPLYPTTVRLTGPETVRLHLSPMRAEGPAADWLSVDLTDYALSGHLHLYGHPDREPLHGPDGQPSIAAGLYGAVGVLAALHARNRDGLGQTVEVSHTETMVALHQFTLLRWSLGGEVLKRRGNRFCGQGQPNGIYRCLDGWISICCVTEEQVEHLLLATGLNELLDHPDITSPLDFQLHPRIMDEVLEPMLAAMSADEAVELLQAMRVPTCHSRMLSELMHDPQLVARDWWHHELKSGQLLTGPPVRMGGHDWVTSAAPSLDEMSAMDLHGLGVSHLRNAVDETPTDRADAIERSTHVGTPADGGDQRPPLTGLKVLDLTRVWAGPLAARIMAELGADVTIVEAPWARGPQTLPPAAIIASRCYPDNEAGDDPYNRNGFINKMAIGKRSLAIDMSKAEGREVFEQLVVEADVVIENFSPRVMPQFGLDEERLHELNPNLTYVTMPGYGRSGPAENYVAYGSALDSHGGLSAMNGYEGEWPFKGGIAWPDPIAGLHGTVATLIALHDQAADPAAGGQTIEVAQFEALVSAVGYAIAEAQVEGDVAPEGNRDRVLAPQGVYPCLGDDRWIAIAVTDSMAWSDLCQLADLDPVFAVMSTADRHAAHDEIDAVLSAWTAKHDDVALARILQEYDIAAAPVHDSRAVLAEPQFAPLFVDVNELHVPKMPIHLSRTATSIARPHPRLGEHNREVLSDMSSFTDAEIDELEASGIIADQPPV